MNDKVDVSEIEKKINKIMELTGASKDKAIVALHDCANELDKAIDMILEGDSINESEWKSQARKKKPKTGTVTASSGGKDSVHLNGDAKKGPGKGRQIRGKAPQSQQTDKQSQQQQNKSERGASRRTGGGDWKSRETNNANDESTTAINNNKEDLDDKLDEWADDTPTSTRDTQRTRSNNNENQFKPHNKYQNNVQDGRRMNTGPRGNFGRSNQFGPGGDRNNQRSGGGTSDRMMERRPYQNKGYSSKKPGGYPNSIDTWSNLTAADNTSSTNNDYAQMTVGNWSDVVSSNASVQQTNAQQTDLTNDDEWTEPSEGTNLTIEQATNKVFSSNKDNQNVSSTNKADDHQLSKMPNLASIVSGVKPTVPSVQQQSSQNVHKSPNQQTTSKPPPQQQILSNSNNQSILNKSSPQQQRQPQNNQQQSQSKIDLAALLKSSQQQPQQPSNNLIRGNIQQQQQQQRSNQPDSNTYGAALLQRLQQRIANTDQDSTLGKSSSANLNDYVNHPYNQNKNLVHNIPSSNYTQQNAPSNLFDNQSHHLHHQNVADQKSLIEKKRRQTKIPETAVEMCGMPTSEHISSLNVQFGALDFNNSAAADTYGLNDDQIANKQFNLSRDSNNEKNNSTSLLSTVRGSQQANDSNKQQQAKDSLLQNIDHHHPSHHQLQDNTNILHQQHADSRKSQQSAGGYQLNAYNTNKNDTSNQHSIYPPNLQNYQSSYGPVNNYGSQNHNNSSHNNSTSNANTGSAGGSSNQHQKMNLKDLSDNSASNNQNSSTSANTTSSSALGNLVNNTTVTTNVLKNSLTATGKAAGIANSNNSMQQQLNVAAPLLGTPQYIMNMSQPGLSTAAFYPVYDMPIQPDHSFRYNQNTQDVKYNRSDAQDGQVGQSNHGNPVQSTQAPVTQTPNHQIFSQFPPYFFYTGVNMMTQGLYQTAAPFLPVQPNPPSGNQPPHAPNSNQPHSTGFGHQPKGAQNQAAAYSAASYASTGYDPMTGHQLTQGQDFSKQNYSSGPPNSNQQAGKQMSSSGTNDLVNNNMYTKSHAQLTKVSIVILFEIILKLNVHKLIVFLLF